MSDRSKMIRFISSHLPDGEGLVTLGWDGDGPITAHVRVLGDDVEIASNCPEWVTLREVYDQLRWSAMPSWEQRQVIRRHSARGEPPSADRLEKLADRIEDYLAVARHDGHGTAKHVSKPVHQSVGTPVADQTMTTRDVARFLGCSYTEARERLLDGRIRAIRDGRWLRTRLAWVQEYVEKQTVPVPSPEIHSIPVPSRRRKQATVSTKGIGYRFLKERAK